MTLLPNPAEAIPSDPVLAATALKTLPHREFGGNLDVKQLIPGTTLRLPVFGAGRSILGRGRAFRTRG
jgi:formamidase